MRKLLAVVATATLTLGMAVIGFAAPASAENPVPASDCGYHDGKLLTAAYDETITVTEAYDETVVVTEAYDETVVTPAVEGDWVNYKWTGGPVEGEPAWPGDGWKSNNGNHNGHPQPVDGEDGFSYDRSKGGSGKADWFHWSFEGAVDEITTIVHHEAVTKLVHHEAVTRVVNHPAVYEQIPNICEEPPVVTNIECEPTAGPVGTNLNGLWGNVDTRSAGHLEYVDGGLHVWTDDASSQAKVSEGTAVSFPLKETGELGLDWTGTAPSPGINLYVNFGADGNGTLVYESVYGQDLWLTNGSSAAVKANAPVNGGGNGSQWHGTINEWLTKYPEAQVYGLAYSLGSGVHGDGVINSITAGCSTYTFDFAEVVVVPEQPADIVTVQTDREGTYDCETGTVSFPVTTTTITHVLVDNVWVAQEPVVVVDPNTRDMTDAEEAAQCVVEPPVTCASFTYQEEAQALFDSDPVKYAHLDGNDNGVPCEALPNTPVETPEKPADVVEVTLSTPTVDCKAGEVLYTETTFTTGWVLVDNEWVKGETTSVDKLVTEKATEEECPAAVIPTPTPTPPAAGPSDPPVAPALVSPSLATTGTNDAVLGGLLTVAVLALIAGAGFVLFRSRGSKNDDDDETDSK